MGVSKGGATPATTALDRAGVSFTMHPYQHDPAAPSYGLEAAEAIGVVAEQVFKTLLADVDGRLVVAVVPVVGSLDLKALATATGGKRAAMAASAAAERATGYVVGGISPLGGRRKLPAFIDVTLNDHATVFVSAGQRGLQMELAPADLVRLTAAALALLAAG